MLMLNLEKPQVTSVIVREGDRTMLMLNSKYLFHGE